MTSDHVGCRLNFPRFVGSQYCFSLFVAGRLTPFRPSENNRRQCRESSFVQKKFKFKAKTHCSFA